MQYTLDFTPVWSSADRLLEGLLATIQLSFTAMILGLFLGLFGAISKTSGPKWLGAIFSVYVEIIRNTPFLVQIYIIYFVLPSFGLRLSPNVAALIALVVNVGAYATEIIRAGILSINRGQIEAGAALGLSQGQIIRHVITKPALCAVYPALTSQFIYLMLNTSVVSVISANDLSEVANSIQSETFAAFEVYLVVTGIYLVLSLGLAWMFQILGRYAFAYQR